MTHTSPKQQAGTCDPDIIRSRIRRSAIIISLCLLTQLAISWKLWIPAGRTFPLVSAFDVLPFRFGLTVDAILVAALVAGLGLLLFRPFSRLAIVLMLATSTLMILEDIVRLQPWLYIFGLMLLVIALRRDKPTDIYALFTMILSGVYFWSGFQKFNVAFAVEIFPWMMEVYGLGNIAAEHHWLAWSAAGLELLIGLGLWFPKTRRPAVIAAIGTHLFIMIAIGPFGHSWNWVILPWNAAMIALLLILYPPRRKQNVAVNYSRKYTGLFGAVFLIVWLLPVFNYFRLWDSHLSGSLYSGNNSEAIFYYHESDRVHLSDIPDEFKFYVPDTDEEFLLIDQWCIDDLEAPFYPEERYFRQVGKHLCSVMERSNAAGIKITVKETFTSEQRLVEYTYHELDDE